MFSSFSYAAAQVEVLSAALRASSLDPQEETTSSVGKGTDSQAELTISDQQNFKPILGDIVPLIGDAVEVRCVLCASVFFPTQISRAPVIELYSVFVQELQSKASSFGWRDVWFCWLGSKHQLLK